MALDLVFQNSTEDRALKRSFFVAVVKEGLEELGLSARNIEISINIVGEEKIMDLNKTYRNKDKVTDVLSFPMNENPLSLPADELTGLAVMNLGDIFICLPFAKKEAKSENVDIERKLAQLTVHGFLHLAGYDHERSENDEKEMFRLENKILRNLNI